MFLGYDNDHESLSEAIKIKSINTLFKVDTKNIEIQPARKTEEHIALCDIFMLVYSSSTKENHQVITPDFITPLKPILTTHWKKSILFKDYGEFFSEAFSEHPDRIEQRNNRLIKILSNAETIVFEDERGNKLHGTLENTHKWTSVSGKGNIDITPGEIASHVRNLNGEIVFSGTFLSTIPFATKYGVAKNLVTLKIEDSKLISFESDNDKFGRDFRNYLDNNEGNRIIEEYGIGTNMGVKKLHGRNAGFEERHPGLHLGFGGGKKGSHHLDMIFSSGKIYADDTLIFDNGFDDNHLEYLSNIR
ncbi:leucyl aminopeptidase [Enterobacter asburiae]|uniref:leucyl aminopeptidase n=1 Tax=Scandinavium sp. UTDF21-P1B TaxID=3446379 RepID=UPI00347BE40E